MICQGSHLKGVNMQKDKVIIGSDNDHYIHIKKENFEIIITKEGYDNMPKLMRARLDKYIANGFKDMIQENTKVREKL